MIAQVMPANVSNDTAAFLGNTVGQWLGLLGTLLGCFVVAKIACFAVAQQAGKLEKHQRTPLLAMALRTIPGPTMMIALAVGLYLASTFMNLRHETIALEAFWIRVSRTIAALAVAWLVFRLVDVLEVFLRKIASKTDTMLDDQLVPLIRKTMRVFVVIVSALYIAKVIFHWNIGALMAGLGIGGLAFALAAKDTLANLFGSITIFVDRPFLMGERVRIKDNDGTIETVGFRSTRIRLLNGHLVTIPNSVVANEVIENIGRRPYLKRVLNVTVTYDTPPEKLQRGIEIIREMLDARKDSFDEKNPARVFFSDFNAESLNILVYYWFVPPDWWDYLQFNHDFNTELLRRFNEEGIEFAFPTQTIYVKQDSPLSAEVRLSGDNRPE
ncbi:MAG: mechanosensitive ion channel family protein [Planctomycetes bacterium]|nr:mechanosensitive ion channel family protein [Planctomycetota bacterium]